MTVFISDLSADPLPAIEAPRPASGMPLVVTQSPTGAVEVRPASAVEAPRPMVVEFGPDWNKPATATLVAPPAPPAPFRLPKESPSFFAQHREAIFVGVATAAVAGIATYMLLKPAYGFRRATAGLGGHRRRRRHRR